jgi:hypothetical protein
LAGKRRGFALTAGAFTPKGINYGWMTELGTDAAANHAVDKIGYQHTTHAPSENPGIPAQHWFAEGWKEAMHDTPQAVSRAVRGALASLLTR